MNTNWCISPLFIICRWNPAVPLGQFLIVSVDLILKMPFTGVPHKSMADDTYRGMFIPKGTYVFANIRFCPSIAVRDAYPNSCYKRIFA